MKLFATAGVVVGLLIAGAVAWAAGEIHYGNCLDAAAATHPDPILSTTHREIAALKGEGSNQAARVAAAKACSRLP